MKIKLFILSIGFSAMINAQDINKSSALQLIQSNAKTFGISNANDSQIPIITNAYTDAQTGLSFIYFQQQYKGIKVYNQIQSATFRGNKLQYKSGNFITNIATKAPSSNPVVSAVDAVKIVAKDLGLIVTENIIETDNQFATSKQIVFSKTNISKRNIKAALVWKTDLSNNIHLAWCISISPNNTADNWNIKIDAITGEILAKDNETIYENNSNNLTSSNSKKIKKNFFGIPKNTNLFSPTPPPTTVSAVYNVVPYPNENKFVAGIATETNPWLKAGAGNAATTNGWHFDGTNNFNITRGNNVFAYDDSLNIDAPGRWATSKNALPNLNFNFTPNFNNQPTETTNRNFATTNLFYWNNLMHDVTYQYGFTEAAGNFQADNLGRGGLGNDFVLAEAQDGGGVNNANFWANPDGDTAIMQMYLFTSNNGFSVISPSSIAGNYPSKEGSMSINNLLKNVGTKTGQLVLYNDDAGGSMHNACSVASNNLSGKIALIEYSFVTGCTYRQRVKNAQDAGAIAAIVVGASANPSTMGGSDNTITIPAMMIGVNDGATIIALLNSGTVVNVKLENGIQFDGDIDNGIIAHEYTHGISIRLTGGAAHSSCLNNAEQAGEGWSDYVALMMTTNWATASLTDGSLSRPIGVYAFNQNPAGKGIRTYPYTTDFSINPSTYNDLNISGQVHYIGSIWCNTLWNMTWGIIKQENAINPNLYDANGTGGNVIALNLVMLGLKLQPCSPGFLDSRDAILAADDILYNGKHKCTIWAAFAKRGMGFSASQGSSNSTSDQVVAFDVPMGISLSKVEPYKIMPLTTNSNFKVNATCQCKSPTNNYKIKAIIPTGLGYGGSSGGVKNGDSIIFSNINFNNPFQTDSLYLNLIANSGACVLDSVINDNRDTKTIGGFSNINIAGTNNWIAASGFAYSPTQSWQIADVEVQTESALRSANFIPNGLSLLSFWHQYEFEPNYDGGLVETSTNGGSTWQNVDGKILQNGYPSTMSPTSALPNQKAFTGTTTNFENTLVNLSELKGLNTQLRFRVGTDFGNGSGSILNGWAVDDITVTNGCGGFVKFYVYDSANNLLDSTSIPVFITPKILPTKYTSFNAKAVEKNTLLQWSIAEQLNVKEYIIEKCSDGFNWIKIGNVAASNQQINYRFTDFKTVFGDNYYRIKAIDFNGSINYSIVRKVNFNEKEKMEIQIVPNPTKIGSKIYLPTNFNAVKIQIFDAIGKIVYEKLTNNSIETYINTNKLSEGTYIVNAINNSGEVLTQKLIITK